MNLGGGGGGRGGHYPTQYSLPVLTQQSSVLFYTLPPTSLPCPLVGGKGFWNALICHWSKQ